MGVDAVLGSSFVYGPDEPAADVRMKEQRAKANLLVELARNLPFGEYAFSMVPQKSECLPNGMIRERITASIHSAPNFDDIAGRPLTEAAAERIKRIINTIASYPTAAIPNLGALHNAVLAHLNEERQEAVEAYALALVPMLEIPADILNAANVIAEKRGAVEAEAKRLLSAWVLYIAMLRHASHSTAPVCEYGRFRVGHRSVSNTYNVATNNGQHLAEFTQRSDAVAFAQGKHICEGGTV